MNVDNYWVQYYDMAVQDKLPPLQQLSGEKIRREAIDGFSFSYERSSFL